MNRTSYVTMLNERTFSNCVESANTIAISGHIRPDGDCVGSCLGLCTYLLDQYPDKQVDVYLDEIPAEFLFLKNSDRIRQENVDQIRYDLCISLDCSDLERLNRANVIFKEAIHTVNIDHHITNEGFGDVSVVCPESSATCEVLYHLLKQGQLFGNGEISFECAEALYTGIVHDTGVFKHSNTTLEAMTTAGELIEYGLNTEKIINDTFFKKTYIQNQILGKALLESMMILDGRMIFSVVYQKDFRLFEATPADTNGVIDQLRITDGVHVAMFLYETETGDFKVSLRSDEYVDVSVIAKEFGGGGHIRAAGCTTHGQMRDIVTNIAGRVEDQLDAAMDEIDLQ
ncbi:MAG: bifunctional oligoribonuclease/PAP phosphatase NrnA [Eubacteriales bacterium]|nr:bifunctional oligoribonuclease/PAP phosphatase NrnA [Eubacteriales bacterium]